MNIIEAINLLDTHTMKAVRKSSWKSNEYIIYDTDCGEKTKLHTFEGAMAAHKIGMVDNCRSTEDIFANDWIIVEKK